MRDYQELTRLPASPPLVVALEGGYHGPSVGACCAAVLRVLLGEEAAPLPHSPPTSRGEKALPTSPHISPHLPISRGRCTFFAMFHNCLYPLLRDRNSSPDNLLFNATYACRLCPPFCFNLLKLLHDEDELDKAAPLHT